MIQCALLLPWGGVHILSSHTPWLSLLPCVVVLALLTVVDFYAESFANQHVKPSRQALFSSIVPFITALVISVLVGHLTPMGSEAHHGLSVGVVLAAMLLLLATVSLTNQSRDPRQSHGLLVGYSTAGLPLYSSQPSTGVSSNWLRPLLEQIMERSESRRIFYFLLLNLVSCR